MTRLWPEGEAVEIWGSEGNPAANPEANPTAFIWRGRSHGIERVHNRWRVHTRWWEPPGLVWREYLKVTTDTGLLCLLFHDLLAGEWFLARVYD
jgi:hypothetical protein